MICISVISKVKDEHIYVAVMSSYGPESAEYKKISSQIDMWVVLCYICLLIEFVIIFSGKTLFNDKYSMMTVGAHIIGIFSTNLFLSSVARHDRMLLVWILSSLLPLGIETTSYVYSHFNYRNKYVFWKEKDLNNIQKFL